MKPMMNHKSLYIILAGAISASMLPSVFLTAPVAAQRNSSRSIIAYRPPNRGAPRTTVGAGSRGCPQSLNVTLSLLAPNDHIGLTSSNRPSFSWFVSDASPVPVEFALVEPGKAKPILVKQLKADKRGIMELNLPKDVPGLLPDKEYRWSVSLVCNPIRRSNDVYAQSWIKFVPMSGATSNGSSEKSTTIEQARIFADGGYWYDALSALNLARQTQPNNPSVSIAQKELLDQIGMTEVIKLPNS
jgi:hypothetical protein